MPIIDTPFDRVAVDLVWPIFPPAETGSKYILTKMDYATGYPGAVPLKDIQGETVAEALVNMFTRVGIPKEILSDQGSQFSSAVMKEVCRLLSLKRLVTTPYHPICNGLIEKFNGMLKNMLRHMCAEKPKDWDPYIGPLLFRYREVKHDSFDYSPFELLYGRTVRGPMSILRELMSNEKVDRKSRAHEYVLDLKDRLQSTCELAQIELQRSQIRHNKHYDRRTKVRSFEKGDEVLVLLPTDSNKLLLQWKCPYEILERVRGDDCRIQLVGRTKAFHANMLKKYWSRKHEDRAHVSHAMVFEPEGDDDELSLFTSSQTETCKDVKVNPELTEEQRGEVMKVLEEFQDVFTDVPGLTNLGKHSITLTTEEPIHGKPYSFPHDMQQEGIREPSWSSDVVICCDYR